MAAFVRNVFDHYQATPHLPPVSLPQAVVFIPKC
jgi:hypothetical protein